MVDLTNARTTRPHVAARLRELEDTHGRLTPRIVLKDARNKHSPLHKGCGFEWSVTKAADKFNLQVARDLIRTVHYLRIVTDRGPVSPPVYVRDPAKKPAQQGYVALRAVMARTPTARAVVIAECRNAIAALNRALVVAATLNLTKEIERAIKSVMVAETAANEKHKAAA